MKNLSMQQPSGRSNISTVSISQRAQYAAERAKVLFACYRRGDANDPDRYIGAVIAILSDYPEETIRYVTDPRTGISNKYPDYMPNAGQVRQACEAHYGPTRAAIETEARERRQIEERKRLMPPEGPKKSYDELVADCRARGLMIGGKERVHKTSAAEFCKTFGISREQFDAIPNAK